MSILATGWDDSCAAMSVTLLIAAMGMFLFTGWIADGDVAYKWTYRGIVAAVAAWTAYEYLVQNRGCI